MRVKIIVVGEGAFGSRHLTALAGRPDVEVACLAGGVEAATRETAARFGIDRWTLDLDEALATPGVEAAILATPTPLHAAQAIRCLEAGRHVLVEIPLAESLAEARRVVTAAERAGRIAMAGHIRRFSPSHAWIHTRLRTDELRLQHLTAQTFFLRRSNINALGQPRSWTDHLLWHHACHSVDLFQHQTGEAVAAAQAMQGPVDPELGIALDLSVQLKTASGVLGSLALSFNNDGPIGSVYRYICDRGTYVARYDELLDGWGEPVDMGPGSAGLTGLELEHAEFFAAIREGRAPASSAAEVLGAYEVLDAIERGLA